MRSVFSRFITLAALVIGLGFGVQVAAATPPSATDMSQGNAKAKVTVIEYASVACPICGAWDKTVYPAFKAKYIDTGKVHFVTREMLVGDDNEVEIATSGFLLARCAGKDNYYKVTEAIYHSQPQLYNDPSNILEGIAKTVGMTHSQFVACITNTTARVELNQRVDSYANNDGVDSTPTFIINGKKMEAGYKTLPMLDAMIASAESGK
jgi:protein-disulfide isomerase